MVHLTFEDLENISKMDYLKDAHSQRVCTGIEPDLLSCKNKQSNEYRFVINSKYTPNLKVKVLIDFLCKDCFIAATQRNSQELTDKEAGILIILLGQS